MPGSGRTARTIMIIVAVVVVVGLLASMAGTPAVVGH
jgi:hypothetical protein